MKIYMAVFLGIVVISLFFVSKEKKSITINTSQKSKESVINEVVDTPQSKIKNKEVLLVPKDINKSKIKNTFTNIDSQEIPEDNILAPEDENIPYDTAKKMDDHIAKEYDALSVDGYEETMAQAEDSFAAIDEHIAQVDRQLEAEEEIAIEFSEQLSIDQEESPQADEEDIGLIEETEI